MPEPLYVLVGFADLLISAISFAMVLRAVLGWFFEPQGRLFDFLFIVTEPVIMPLRKLFVKMNWFQGTPIDMAYMFTYVVLFLLQLVLDGVRGI